MCKETTKKLFAMLVAGAFFVNPAFADNFFVSPDGTPDAEGTEEKPLSIFAAFSKDSPAGPGDTIYLMPGRYDGKIEDGERVPFNVALKGAENNPIVIRPAPGTLPWNAPHLNGTIVVTTSYVHVRGLEIGDLHWDRFKQRHKNNSALHTGGGLNCKIINCNLFGGSMGSGVWKRATNFEVYGTLIHDFGKMDMDLTGRGHGHAVYTQNIEGTKHFEHNMFYRGCGWNFDLYTQQSDVDGYEVIENISFIGGYYMPGQTSFAYGLAGYQQATDLRFEGNVGYQPRNAQKYRATARLIVHSKTDVIHEQGTFNNNYIMGGYRAFSASRWKDLTIKNNTFWGTRVLQEIASAPGGSGINDKSLGKPDPENYHVDGNTYYHNGHQKPFLYGDGVETGGPSFGEEALTFEEWQELGFDKNGKVIETPNGRPTGTQTFVFPNEYSEGRGHIGVFNWADKAEIKVDLSSILDEGQTYRIYNVLDFDTTIRNAVPVAHGEYEGGAVPLPMRSTEYCPNFDAFLVLSN